MKKTLLKRFNIDNVSERPFSDLRNEVGETELLENSRAGIVLEGNSEIRLEAVLEHEIAKVNKMYVEETMAAVRDGHSTGRDDQ